MTNPIAQKTKSSLLIEGLLNAIKTARMIILTVALMLSLALNVAIVAVDAVAEVAEEIFERLTRKAAANALVRQQVRQLSIRVAAQERTIAANATGLRRSFLDIQLRDRQMAALSKDLVSIRASSAAEIARERARATRMVRETSARMSRRIAVDAGRNVSSMVLEAVPWIGIGVVAGTTALELTDACNNMRDLYDLEVAFDPTVADDAEATIVCGLPVPTANELWAMTKAKTSSIWTKALNLVPEAPDIDLRFWN